MDGKIGLLVAGEVWLAGVDGTGDGILEDRSANEPSAPLDLARASDVDGYELHVTLAPRATDRQKRFVSADEQLAVGDSRCGHGALAHGVGAQYPVLRTGGNNRCLAVFAEGIDLVLGGDETRVVVTPGGSLSCQTSSPVRALRQVMTPPLLTM